MNWRFLLVGLSMLAACASAQSHQIPDVFARNLCRPDYLCAVGAGSTLQDATAHARSELAKQEKVKVSSRLRTTMSEYVGSSGQGFVSTLENETIETIDRIIQNARTAKTWQNPDGRQYWVKVRISRAELARQRHLRGQLADRLLKIVLGNLRQDANSAQRAEKRGNGTLALRQWAALYSRSAGIRDLDLLSTAKIARLERERRSIRLRLERRLLSLRIHGNRKTVKLVSGQPPQLPSIALDYTVEGRTISLPGAALTDNDCALIDCVVPPNSDMRGFVEIAVGEVPDLGTNWQVSFALLPEVYAALGKQPRRVKIRGTVVDPMNLPLLVVVDHRDAAVVKEVESRAVSWLHDQGYSSVIPGSNRDYRGFASLDQYRSDGWFRVYEFKPVIKAKQPSNGFFVQDVAVQYRILDPVSRRQLQGFQPLDLGCKMHGVAGTAQLALQLALQGQGGDNCSL